MADTIIEECVKIDNLVQIGHNCKIGAYTVIAGCAGIAGSTTIGRHCMIGGAVGIAGHVTLADYVIVTAKSGVSKSLLEARHVHERFPAVNHADWNKSAAFAAQHRQPARPYQGCSKTPSEAGQAAPAAGATAQIIAAAKLSISGHPPAPRKKAGEHQEASGAVTRWRGRRIRRAPAARVINPPAPASAVIIAQSMREEKHHEHRKNQSRHS